MCPAPRREVLGIVTEAPKENKTHRPVYRHREMDAVDEFLQARMEAQNPKDGDEHTEKIKVSKEASGKPVSRSFSTSIVKNNANPTISKSFATSRRP